ncbi:23S rRNA (pseudouridine(1915)-N(3))-methyltransferase RlmH [Sphingobacteriales bacterium UPWRP_1]|nr:23S rRNA (pseudouridine(1915)-N(3))-methyltransferase RlmH [Sphingobacteriales bacterium TSM_CSM]PSJ74471.1 23S rRNA (pseudouridine(1915)-N(3))-methyltransferase RlmH [Sphingobacteriales bacterium UPWRP_1]
MKITLLLTGKTNEKYIDEGVKTYEARVKRYLGFDIVTLPEVRNLANPDVIRAKEAISQLAAIDSTDYLMLLCERGKQHTSQQFAATLQQLMNRSTKHLKFLVGGAYGFAPAVYNRANEQMALSVMTFSHQLVRLVFMEQLYRAFTILHNEPYHHN